MEHSLLKLEMDVDLEGLVRTGESKVGGGGIMRLHIGTGHNKDGGKH